MEQGGKREELFLQRLSYVNRRSYLCSVNYKNADVMGKKSYHYEYPHPAVTMDSLVFSFDGKKLRVLLIERGNEPYKGKWAFPGGFLNMDESCEAGALRELEEETGLTGVSLRQFHTFSQPGRDPRERIVTVSYYALTGVLKAKAGDDAAKAQWFGLDEVPPMAFDHNEMLQVALKCLRERLRLEPIGLGILPEVFIISQLRRLYEAVLGRKINQRLFRKRILRTGLLIPLDEHTPSPIETARTLYRFDEERYQKIAEEGFEK